VSKCIWNLGSKCHGKVKNVNVFYRGAFALGLDIYVCESHIKEHDNIMSLYRRGYDIDDIFKMSADKKESLLKEENDNDITDS